jgi:hypothetical protein
MLSRSTRLFARTTLVFAVLTAAGCGDAEEPAASVSSTSTDVSSTVEQLARDLVPPVDQFGVEQFKVVYALDGQETGTRTMWVEGYGTRVGIEEDLTVFGQAKRSVYYWDGNLSHMKDLPDGEVSAIEIRTKVSEPTAFAITPASDLEVVGYARVGEKNVAGLTCEHWKNDQLNYEGCRWNSIELEFLNGAGTPTIVQRVTATEFVDGEGIPDRIRALAE